MALVFRQFFRRFGGVCGDESSLQSLALSGSLLENRDASAEDQAEQMSGILGENRVGLRPGERHSARSFGNAAEVVALVRVQRGQHAVRFDRHRSEKEDTVGFAFTRQDHHPVEQSVGALLRGELRDIGSANHTFRSSGTRTPIIESCLWKRILRSVKRASPALVECTAGEKGEQSDESDCGNDPRKGRSRSSRNNGSFGSRERGSWLPAVMTVASAGTQSRTAAGAGAGLEGSAAVGAEFPRSELRARRADDFDLWWLSHGYKLMALATPVGDLDPMTGRSSSMRIVLSNSSSRWGGVHKVTEILARGLTQLGHDVTVFGYPGGMLEERMLGVVPFEPILKGMDLHPVVMMRAAAALRKHQADVVLAMMKKDVRLTVPAAKATGIPSVVRHANDRALRGWLYDRVFFGMLPRHHIVNSESTRKTLLESAPWIDPDDVTVIYNGIDPEPFESATPVDLGVPESAFTFGFAGRLEVRKGLLDLAHAWKIVTQALPDAWLVITGKGPDESRAREAFGDTPRVKWLGYRADVSSVLASLDVLVVPSHWEGFGLIAAEGLAAGVPVVAAKASSLPEIIEHGVDGWLVPAKDPDTLARTLIEVAANREMRDRIASRGVAKVKSKFGIERMVSGYESTLRRIAGVG